jgi:hypothetical protein
MRKAALGVLVGAGLVIAVAGVMPDGGEVFAERPAPSWSRDPGTGLIAVSSTLDEKHQQIAVIDPRLQVMSVYHVELASGEITLRSVRNFHWDLQMMQYNGSNPLPMEIRALLENRQ